MKLDSYKDKKWSEVGECLSREAEDSQQRIVQEIQGKKEEERGKRQTQG